MLEDRTARPRVGFIGLGMMGLPMVENLAGHSTFDVFAFDRDERPFEALKNHRAWGRNLHRAQSLASLGAVDVVITMLPNSAITNEVFTGPAGLADALTGETIVIDMGSSNPQDTVRLGARLAGHGAVLLDAPVSGGVAKARAGTLTIMVGGPESTLEAVRTLLQAMGSTILPTGALGSAHAMKALNNYVHAAGLLAVSEAALIAERTGLDLQRFSAVLNASSGRNVSSETKLTQFIIPRSYAGGFALRLQAKDIAIASTLEERSGIRAPLLELCLSLWEAAVDGLEPGADNTAIHRFIEQMSGPEAGTPDLIRRGSS